MPGDHLGMADQRPHMRFVFSLLDVLSPTLKLQGEPV
jgi:hypothetical protein